MKRSSIENNLYLQNLNMVIKSHAFIGKYFPIPLKISIEDVRPTTESPTYIKLDMFQDGDNIGLIEDSLYKESVFYHCYEVEKVISTIDFIYKFIDWDLITPDLETYRDVYGVYNLKDFREFILNCHFITMDDLKFLEINVYNLIGKLKTEFSDKLVKIFNYDDTFPKIPMKKDDFIVEDSWLPYMSYDYNMITFQIASEFPMQIWFSENIGKGFYDWSWREHEAKRIYITQKHRIEDFKESVKAYNIEKSTEDRK